VKERKRCGSFAPAARHGNEHRGGQARDLKVVHRILCIHLGTPPTKFPWQWNDKDKKFHRDGELTPQQFARKYLTLPSTSMSAWLHDPRPTSPFNRTFTVQHLGNVVGGGIVLYLNVRST